MVPWLMRQQAPGRIPREIILRRTRDQIRLRKSMENDTILFFGL